MKTQALLLSAEERN